MIKPLDELIITQGFGERKDYYGPLGHQGTDFRTKFSNPNNSRWNNFMGWQPCYALEDGICTAYYDKTNYGIHVWLEAESGNRYLYAHLKGAKPPNPESVIVGSVLKYKIKAGEIMAITDNTGKSTGSHLHFSYKPKGLNSYVDPMPLFQDRSKNYKVTYLSDTNDLVFAFAFCNEKLKEFSGGLLGLEYVFKNIPPVYAPTGFDLDQFEAMSIVDTYGIQTGHHGAVLGYYGQNTSKGYATTVTNGGIEMSYGYRTWPELVLLYEIAHQLVRYYNRNRGTNPFIENIDNYKEADVLARVKEKVIQLLPYLAVF